MRGLLYFNVVMYVKLDTLNTRREERKKMFALRLSHYLGVYEGIEVFELLPPRVQVHFLRMSYGDIIYQLLSDDYQRGLTLQGLGIKYGITKQYASKLLKNGQQTVDTE